MESLRHHDRLTIRLHWVTALLVVLLWGSAQIIDLFPRGTPRVNMRSVHIILGVLLVAIVVWRLTWRATSGSRLAAPPPAAWLSSAVHWLLYALLVSVLLLGIANVWIRGDSIFELFKVPSISGDKELRHIVATLHRWAANSIVVVAGAHALAALAHHHVLKDDVLARMWPSMRRARRARGEAARP